MRPFRTSTRRRRGRLSRVVGATVVLRVDQDAVVDQQHQVGSAVVGDVDDQRFARLEVAPFFFTRKTLFLENGERQRGTQRRGLLGGLRRETQNLDVM